MSIYLGLPLFQAFLSLILLIIVLRAKSQDAARYIFAMYLAGLLVWGVLIYLMRSSPDLETAYFWEKLLFPLGMLLSVLLFHISLTFGGFKAKKWVISAGYAYFAITLVLSEMGLVVRGMQTMPYGYAPVGGPLFIITAIGSMAFVVAAISNLWKYSRTAIFKEERNRSLYIASGMIVSLLGGIFDVLPLIGLPLYPGLIIGNIFFCIVTSIAILKYRLLGIHIIMRKGLAYFLTSAIATLPYLLTLFIFEGILSVSVPMWAMVFIFLLLAFILLPAWRFVQSLVDKLLYMSRYEFLIALDDFSQKSHQITDINSLGKSLVELVSRALRSSNVYLFLPSDRGEFNLIASAKDNKPVPNFLSSHPILSWLRSHKVVLRHEEIAYISRLQSLTAEETNQINAINAEIFVPVLDKEDKVVGIMVMGPKLTNQPYTGEDEQLILTVTRRLALELENARLYSLEKTARNELQKQNDLKTEFLHNAAHELKTPLTAIISSSEILAEKLSLTKDDLDQKLSNNIYKSALVMDRRVSELLDFARVQIGSIQINKQKLDINLIVQDIVLQLTPLFTSRQQHLALTVQQVGSVQADKDKIEQVFINLLSNANKYSPNNGNIFIRTRQNNGSVLVEVEDSAPIISDEEKSKLFIPYYRGEDAKVRQRVPGLGLGLAITKKIIDMHGGKIWVDSNPGKGNIFAFSLTAAL